MCMLCTYFHFVGVNGGKRWFLEKKKKYTVRRDEYLQKLVAMLYKLYIYVAM